MLFGPTIQVFCQQIALIHDPAVHCKDFEDYQERCRKKSSLSCADPTCIFPIAARIDRYFWAYCCSDEEDYDEHVVNTVLYQAYLILARQPVPCSPKCRRG
ncbi:uncharacterized protein BDV17DRAFT_156475 [Aspergillus undulatus]|uniref:uncharacterized protein n=1 Tax=Aspergillus undulatus TaxID=1810928 RepID=UPI003CCD7092